VDAANQKFYLSNRTKVTWSGESSFFPISQSIGVMHTGCQCMPSTHNICCRLYMAGDL